MASSATSTPSPWWACDGSIDFLCLPALRLAVCLRRPRSTRSAAAASSSRRCSRARARKQLYLPDTNVLLTRFLGAQGVAELSDFMPVEDAGQAHTVVRRAKTVRGEVRFQMRCEPRFDYARATHTVERRSDTEVLFLGRAGDGELALRLRAVGPDAGGERRGAGRVHAGRRRRRPGSSSRWCSRGRRRPRRSPTSQSDAFKQTVNFWRALGRALAPTGAAGARW